LKPLYHLSLLRCKSCLLIILVVYCHQVASGQASKVSLPEDSARITQAAPVPSRLAGQSLKKWSACKAALIRRSEKQLNNIRKTDLDIYRKLYAFDSTAAKNLYPENLEKQYEDKIAGIRSKAAATGTAVRGEYQPYLDSLRGILLFADKYAANNKLKASLKGLSELQGKLQDADQVKEFVQQRKAMIKEYLSKYTSLPSGLKDSYDRLNRDLYYYSAQLREYRESLNEPDKLLKKTLGIMNKMPAFKSFMEKHSMLSELFGGAAEESVLRGSANLVTREQIQSRIQTQLTGGGAGAAGALSQQLRTARQQIDALQSKVLTNGKDGGTADLPEGYIPNQLKKKTLWQRIEYNWNLQNLPATNVLPVISALGLSAGYKFSENAIGGIGVAYQLGLGKGISELKLSNQGVGLRTYFDLKLKNSFWLSAGAEENYMHQFSKIEEINHLPFWQKSALIGVMKKTKIGKQTNSIQLLFDLLASQQVPRAQLLKIRLAHKL
jgi:hypothetical protein